MGCGESKPARTKIKVTTARPGPRGDPTEEAVDLTKPRSGTSGRSTASAPLSAAQLMVEDDLDIPNCDLGVSTDIPNCDLGVSIDIPNCDLGVSIGIPNCDLEASIDILNCDLG